MWLEANQRYELRRDDDGQNVVPWIVDVMEYSSEEEGLAPCVVGRLLADELRPHEIIERGGNPWHAADADSCGLLDAYASLLDDDGDFRSEEFDAVGEQIVYMYRFELHEEFAKWKLAVLDSFCRLFLSDALILAQYHSTWLALAEFESIGFRPLSDPQELAPSNASEIDQSIRYMVRDNAANIPLAFSDYPADDLVATEEHEDWVESKGPWDELC